MVKNLSLIVALLLAAPAAQAQAHEDSDWDDHCCGRKHPHTHSRTSKDKGERTEKEELQDKAWENYNYGQYLATAGWFSKAVRVFTRATELDPTQGLYHLARARALLALNREQDAVESLKAAYRRGPRDIRHEAAVELVHVGEPVPADETARAQKTEAAAIGAVDKPVNELKKTVAWRHFEYGRVLAEDGLLSRALPPLSRAIEMDPDEGRFFLTRGLVQLDLGKKAGALEDLRAAAAKGVGWIKEEAAYEISLLGGNDAGDESLASGTTAPSGQASNADVSKALSDISTEEPPAAPAAAVKKGTGAVGETKSLYDRLGGAPAIRAVVDDFLTRVGNDKRIKARFAKANLRNLGNRLVEQIGAAAGGPEVYTGGNMKVVHKGMGIKGSEFTAMVEDLVAAMNTLKVPQKEQEDVLAVVGPMRPEIVEIED